MNKSIHKLCLVLFSGFIFLANAGSLQAETDMSDHQHSHGHDAHAEHGVSGLSLDHGQKWKTDAPLRQGMLSINDAVMKNVTAYHHDKLTKTDAQQLASHINDQVNFLVANCKLEPGADATLHVLIGDLLTGADKVAKEPLSVQGMPQLVKALQLYPDYFEHQGWKKFTVK
ncbi:MAG: hypothetical protein OQK98_12730 [Gammaproteobacteria bacterium]|nr:hypothetical protein [Gammaproteobacteria bacterium]